MAHQSRSWSGESCPGAVPDDVEIAIELLLTSHLDAMKRKLLRELAVLLLKDGDKRCMTQSTEDSMLMTINLDHSLGIKGASWDFVDPGMSPPNASQASGGPQFMDGPCVVEEQLDNITKRLDSHFELLQRVLMDAEPVRVQAAQAQAQEPETDASIRSVRSLQSLRSMDSLRSVRKDSRPPSDFSSRSMSRQRSTQSVCRLPELHDMQEHDTMLSFLSHIRTLRPSCSPNFASVVSPCATGQEAPAPRAAPPSVALTVEDGRESGGLRCATRAVTSRSCYTVEQMEHFASEELTSQIGKLQRTRDEEGLDFKQIAHADETSMAESEGELHGEESRVMALGNLVLHIGSKLSWLCQSSFGMLPSRRTKWWVVHQSILGIIIVAASCRGLYRIAFIQMHADDILKLGDAAWPALTMLVFVTVHYGGRMQKLSDLHLLLDEHWPGFGLHERWKWQISREACDMAVVWGLAVLCRSMSWPSLAEVPDIVVFAGCSAYTLTSVLNCLSMVSLMAGMIDSFCAALSDEPDHEAAARQWHYIQGILRTASNRLQTILLVLQLASIAAVGMALTIMWKRGIRGSCIALVAPIIVASGIAHGFYAVAKVTDKCARVPAFVNSKEMNGAPLSAARQSLVDYITSSQAGFYLFEVKLGSAQVAKWFYHVGAATPALSSRI